MKKTNKILKALAIFSLVGAMGIIFTSTSMAQTRTICTQDVKMCSDGTFVGRTGPNCEFVCSKNHKPIKVEERKIKQLKEKRVLMINELKNQIQKIKERIQEILADNIVTLTQKNIKFTKKLKIGSTDRYANNEVSKLQKFLISENVYPEKLVTGYYGKLTSRAVQRLKKKYGIITYPGVEWSPKIYEQIPIEKCPLNFPNPIDLCGINGTVIPTKFDTKGCAIEYGCKDNNIKENKLLKEINQDTNDSMLMIENSSVMYKYNGYKYTLKGSIKKHCKSDEVSNDVIISYSNAREIDGCADYFIVDYKYFICSSDYFIDEPIVVNKLTGTSTLIGLETLTIETGGKKKIDYGRAVKKTGECKMESSNHSCTYFYNKQYQFIGIDYNHNLIFAEWKLKDGIFTKEYTSDWGSGIEQPNKITDSTKEFRKNGKFIKNFVVKFNKNDWKIPDNLEKIKDNFK